MDKPRRILYIDDDPGLRRLVEKLLARRGHSVVCAGSGQEGIERAREGGFDLIALDHFMPAMDGMETLAALQGLPGCPPVVYVTGSDETRIAVDAMKAGAAEHVVKSASGDFVDLLETAFANALARLRLEQARDKATAELKAANLRLEALLREVNHRVANSLQLVISMVSMQSRLLPDQAARAALKDTERRIQAIAAVHRRLYTSGDAEGVEMDEYLAAIVQELQETWSNPVSPRAIALEAEALRLETDKAVSLGVIVNELVSNACKYAYAEGEEGEVRIRLKREGENTFRLEVEDDGCGCRGDETPKGTGLGSKLVSAMAGSLQGTLEYDPSHEGCRAVLVAQI
ncbi:MAG: histidine kinase dimerization/phosphoacceptor domain -containing protein [Croceibacterium sp.]